MLPGFDLAAHKVTAHPLTSKRDSPRALCAASKVVQPVRLAFGIKVGRMAEFVHLRLHTEYSLIAVSCGTGARRRRWRRPGCMRLR